MNGAWTIYDDIEQLIMPDDLAKALAQNPTAEQSFERFSNSSKKNILWWIKSARRNTTRAKRIVETVAKAGNNRMANHPSGRDTGPTP